MSFKYKKYTQHTIFCINFILKIYCTVLIFTILPVIWTQNITKKNNYATNNDFHLMIPQKSIPKVKCVYMYVYTCDQKTKDSHTQACDLPLRCIPGPISFLALFVSHHSLYTGKNVQQIMVLSYQIINSSQIFGYNLNLTCDMSWVITMQINIGQQIWKNSIN